MKLTIAERANKKLLKRKKIYHMNLKTALFLVQGGKCFYCDTPMILESPTNPKDGKPIITIDHVLPKSLKIKKKISSASYEYLKVAACYQCNHEKGNKFPSKTGLVSKAMEVARKASKLISRIENLDLEIEFILIIK